jgi:hypothetical protein
MSCHHAIGTICNQTNDLSRDNFMHDRRLLPPPGSVGTPPAAADRRFYEQGMYTVDFDRILQEARVAV